MRDSMKKSNRNQECGAQAWGQIFAQSWCFSVVECSVYLGINSKILVSPDTQKAATLGGIKKLEET